jgi:hypothetical protein
VIYFFRKGTDARTCETRLSAEKGGYELVVTDGGVTTTEPFENLADMLAREHELVQAWRATGWREVGRPHKRA